MKKETLPGKCMGTRLRKIKENPGIGGKKKLSDSMITKLSQYYGNAVRRNINTSVKEMKISIWAAFHHYSSSKDEPQHTHCTPECQWQKVQKEGKTYKFIPGLPPQVLEKIKPAYEDLTKEDLLERCLGGYRKTRMEVLITLFGR